jgi:hypothetical protein
MDNNLRHTERKSIRERINIYGGMVAGAALPSIVFRYMMGFAGEPIYDDLMWIPSVLVSIPFSIGGLAAGLASGILGANELRRNRLKCEDRKRSIKDAVDNRGMYAEYDTKGRRIEYSPRPYLFDHIKNPFPYALCRRRITSMR